MSESDRLALIACSSLIRDFGRAPVLAALADFNKSIQTYRCAQRVQSIGNYDYRDSDRR